MKNFKSILFALSLAVVANSVSEAMPKINGNKLATAAKREAATYIGLVNKIKALEAKTLIPAPQSVPVDTTTVVSRGSRVVRTVIENLVKGTRTVGSTVVNGGRYIVNSSIAKTAVCTMGAIVASAIMTSFSNEWIPLMSAKQALGGFLAACVYNQFKNTINPVVVSAYNRFKNRNNRTADAAVILEKSSSEAAEDTTPADASKSLNNRLNPKNNKTADVIIIEESCSEEDKAETSKVIPAFKAKVTPVVTPAGAGRKTADTDSSSESEEDEAETQKVIPAGTQPASPASRERYLRIASSRYM